MNARQRCGSGCSSQLRKSTTMKKTAKVVVGKSMRQYPWVTWPGGSTIVVLPNDRGFMSCTAESATRKRTPLSAAESATVTPKEARECEEPAVGDERAKRKE